MQCHRAARRNVCSAHNAYSPALALRAFFGTTSSSEADRDADGNNDYRDNQTPYGLPKVSSNRHEDGSASRSTSNTGPLKHRHLRLEQQPTIAQSLADNGHNPSSHSMLASPDDNTDTPSRMRMIYGHHPPKETPASIDERLRRRAGLGTFKSKKDGVKLQGPEFHSTDKMWKRYILWCRDTVNSYRATPAQRHLVDVSKLREQLNYTPKVIWPAFSPMEDPTPIPWAVPRSEARGKDATKILSQEIKKFAQYMSPTPAEHTARQAAADDVKKFISDFFNADGQGKTSLELFGSEKTGLALPLSDIDVRIFDTSGRETHRHPKKMQNRMQLLYKALLASDKFTSVHYRHGNYPLLVCQHCESGLDVQIVSAESTAVQQGITVSYLTEMPHLKPIFLLIRTFFSMRGLLDVYHGGLGSYGTFVSVLAVLNRKSSGQPPATEGDALCRYLAFFDRIDTTRHGLAVFPRGLFMKHDRDKQYHQHSLAARKRGDPVRAGQWIIGQRSNLQPYMLCLQDPADPRNDLGKRSHAIKHILTSLQYHKHGLWNNLKEFEVCQSRGIDWHQESMLTPLVGRCHEVYHARRRKLEEYGQRSVEGKQKTRVVETGGTNVASASRGEGEASNQRCAEQNVT